MIELICLQCGKSFFRHLFVLKKGRGKYCSKKCTYIAMSDIAKKREFGKWMIGKRHSKESKEKMSRVKKGKIPKNFKEMQKRGWDSNKGRNPWNKGIKGSIEYNSGSFRKTGWTFEGTKKEYQLLHKWVVKIKGKASYCSYDRNHVGRFEWANKSHTYKKEVDDWISLCKKCHFQYDESEKRREKYDTIR